MKTIFRYKNTALLLAAFMALGVVTGIAQTPTPAPAAGPCEDAAGQTVLSDKVRELFPKKDLESQKAKIEASEEFLAKYGSCPSAVEFTDYLKPILPKWKATYKAQWDAAEKEKRYKRFDAAIKTTNFDDAYASGKDLASEPDQLDLIITLGSIGYDEAYKANNKYNDDTLKYARQAISALDAGKTAKTYGLFQWSFKTKEHALAELNLTIGYITQVAQKNKKDAAGYLFKATQGTSETAKNPIPYELIGGYYFDELNKLVGEIQTMVKDQSDTDTPEIAKAKVEAIKAKVALSNGTSERAMDAFSRAFTYGQAPAYKAKMKKNVEDAYKVRFGNATGVDAWIASAVSKPFVNPTTPVTPISDPEPAKTDATTSTPATTTAKPAGTTTTKPAADPATKPAPATTKPGASAKPQASAKKVAKRKTTR